jgi:MFS family permease
MVPSLRDWWRRLRVNAAHLTTGGSWTVQLSSATQRNLRSFFFDGLFASGTDSITVTYLTLYVLALGASSADIGLMTALASLNATLLLIPGAILVDRIGNRKKIVLISSGFIGRICLLLLALVPIFYHSTAAIYIAIGLKVLMDGANNFSLPAWVSLAGDVVPLSWRGRYFGTRNLAMGISAILVIYGFGQFITWIGPPDGYQWALGLAFVFGIISASFFSRIKDYRDINQKIPTQSYSLKSLFATLKNDRNFLGLCGFTALWNFSINIAGPFFNVFLVKDLSATASIIGVVAVVGKISGLPSQRFFGGLVDRWGSGKLMRLMAFIIPFLTISWYFVQATWQAIPINIVGGILWAGMNLASFNLLLETSPQEQRARYSAMYQIAVALSTAIGATLGGFVADQWGIRLVFLLSGIGRLIAAFVLLKVGINKTSTIPQLESG